MNEKLNGIKNVLKIHHGWKFDFHGWDSSMKVGLTNDKWISYILDESKCSWMNIVHEQQTKLHEIL